MRPFENQLSILPRQQRERILAGAARYAAMDRSDPFAYSRAISHAKNGVSSIHVKDGKDVDHFYDAEKVIVMRKIKKSDGEIEVYPTEEYHNGKRP